MTEQAWKRPVLARAKPHRQLAANISLTGSRKFQKASETMTGAAKGAQLGYEVSEEQMEAGRAQARFHDIPGSASDLFGAGFADLKGSMGSENFLALSERLMKDSLLWVEFVARSVQWQMPGNKAEASETAKPERGASGGDPVGFITEVSSIQPVEVTFQPHPGAESRLLGVHDLRGLDSASPVIPGVEVTREGDQWRLKIEIGDSQPPGVYTGIVFDREDGAIRGALSVAVKGL